MESGADMCPSLWAVEPACHKPGRGAWDECPPLYFSTWAPTCDRCAAVVHWIGPPESAGAGVLVYRVMCQCVIETGPGASELLVDEIEVGFPLRMGGDFEFWENFRWRVQSAREQHLREVERCGTCET